MKQSNFFCKQASVPMLWLRYFHERLKHKRLYICGRFSIVLIFNQQTVKANNLVDICKLLLHTGMGQFMFVNNT